MGKYISFFPDRIFIHCSYVCLYRLLTMHVLVFAPVVGVALITYMNMSNHQNAV